MQIWGSFCMAHFMGGRFPMLPSNGVCLEYWHDLPWAINQRALLEATLEVDDEDMVVEVQSSEGEGDIVLPFTSD